MTDTTALRPVNGHPGLTYPSGDHEWCDHTTDPCENDSTTVSWDIGFYTLIAFERRGDGTLQVCVNSAAEDVTVRTFTAPQLRAFASSLLELAEASS